MKPLIDDNAVEPDLAPYPDIPAELPGVDLKSNIPAVTVDVAPEPSEEELAAKRRLTALANANFGPREQALLDEANIAGVDLPQQPVYNVHHHNINLVPHGQDEIAPNDDDSDDSDYVDDGEENRDASTDVTELEENNDSIDSEDSDDETYMEGEGDKYESDDQLDDEFKKVATRSGRLSQRNQNYRDYTFVASSRPSLQEQMKISIPTPKSQSGTRTDGIDLSLESILKSVQSNSQETVLIQEDELPYLGVIMAQMSLKQGLKVFGE
jgi:hypothetical protein